MSKNILIVENDAALSRAMKDKLVARGFEVAETSDGKGCAELVRRTRPNLVVLAVDLAAGQNGYIICKKLKSDDELKTTPVVIVGNPDGFGQHKKLKTHADDYLGKPFDSEAIVDRAGALIGLPEPVAEEIVEDGALSLGDMLEEDKSLSEDVELLSGEQTVGNGDPDFEMVDAMFDESSSGSAAQKAAAEDELPSAEYNIEEDIRPAFVEEDVTAEKTTIGMMTEPPPPPPASHPLAKLSAADAGELRALKSKVTELTGSLSEARSRSDELGEKVRELESQLESTQTDLQTAKSAGGKSDSKDLFALKDQVNKKDKEILRLKNELNAKEQEVVDLHEKETLFEQQTSEASGELARRDAQIKTLTTKGDQLATDRKKLDQQLVTAKEEARGAGAKLSTLQGEFDSMQERIEALERELETQRTAASEAESARQTAESTLSELRGDYDAIKSQNDDRERELEEVRAQVEQVQLDLESAKAQATSQATAFAEEVGGLRKRVGELEELGARHGERAKALFGRIKHDESVRDRSREALQQALSALDEPAAQSVDDLMNEVAEA